MSAEALSAPVGVMPSSAASLEGESPSVPSTSLEAHIGVTMTYSPAQGEVEMGGRHREISVNEVLSMPILQPAMNEVEAMVADFAQRDSVRLLDVRAELLSLTGQQPKVEQGSQEIEQPTVPLLVAPDARSAEQSMDVVGEEETRIPDPVLPHEEFPLGLVDNEPTSESEVLDRIDEGGEEVPTLNEEPEFDDGRDETPGENQEEVSIEEDSTDPKEDAEAESEAEVEEDGESEETEESDDGEEDETTDDRDQPEEEQDPNDKEDDENDEQEHPRPGPIVDEGANQGRIDALVDAARESQNNNGQVEGDALAAALRRTSGLESGIVKQISAPVEDGTFKFIEVEFSGQTYADTSQATQAIVSTVMDNTAVDVGFGPAVGEEAVNKVLGGNMPNMLPDRRTKAS